MIHHHVNRLVYTTSNTNQSRPFSDLRPCLPIPHPGERRERHFSDKRKDASRLLPSQVSDLLGPSANSTRPRGFPKRSLGSPHPPRGLGLATLSPGRGSTLWWGELVLSSSPALQWTLWYPPPRPRRKLLREGVGNRKLRSHWSPPGFQIAAEA